MTLKIHKNIQHFEVPIHTNKIYISIPSHRKHTGCPITKTNELSLFRGKKLFFFFCDHHKTCKDAACGHNLQFRVNSTRQAITGRNLCDSKIKLHHHYEIIQHLDVF